MKNLLKYLIPLLVIVAFHNAAGRFDIPSQYSDKSNTPVENSTFSVGLSSVGSCLNLPRQISVSSPIRVEESARRIESYSRQSVVFVKAGKLINTGIRYSIQKMVCVVKTSLTQHSSKLIFLGKLII